jgi:hypothetical protein
MERGNLAYDELIRMYEYVTEAALSMAYAAYPEDDSAEAGEALPFRQSGP